MQDSTGATEHAGDRLNRMGTPTDAGGKVFVYAYDEVGNRLTKLESGTTTTYSYDVANQLSYEYTPSARTTYTYDQNGNTTVINAGGSLTTHSWDMENHLTVVRLAGGGRTTATYDGDGKRRCYKDSAGSTNFQWDGENIAREVSDAGTTQVAYTLVPRRRGGLVSQRRSGATSFHHYDALGSTERLTDSSQSTVISYLYRAFGEQSVLSGSSANRFTWIGESGYYRQPDTSDFWVRARVYLPRAARWVSRDPLCLQDGRSVQGVAYRYADNEPRTRSDPSGMWTSMGSCAGHGHDLGRTIRGWLAPLIQAAEHDSELESRVKEVPVQQRLATMLNNGGPPYIYCTRWGQAANGQVRCGQGTTVFGPQDIILNLDEAFHWSAYGLPYTANCGSLHCLLLHEMLHILYGFNSPKAHTDLLCGWINRHCGTNYVCDPGTRDESCAAGAGLPPGPLRQSRRGMEMRGQGRQRGGMRGQGRRRGGARW